MATAHRYTPALHGLRCRPVDSAPHVCIYALHQLALRIACACMWCVCVLARARARARQSLTKKSPLPALIMHIPAAAACRCHIPVTGSQCTSVTVGVQACARVRVRARQDLTAITPPPLACAYARSSSLQIAHADDAPRVLSRHRAAGVQACSCTRVCKCARGRI